MHQVQQSTDLSISILHDFYGPKNEMKRSKSKTRYHPRYQTEPGKHDSKQIRKSKPNQTRVQQIFQFRLWTCSTLVEFILTFVLGMSPAFQILSKTLQGENPPSPIHLLYLCSPSSAAMSLSICRSFFSRQRLSIQIMPYLLNECLYNCVLQRCKLNYTL